MINRPTHPRALAAFDAFRDFFNESNPDFPYPDTDSLIADLDAIYPTTIIDSDSLDDANAIAFHFYLDCDITILALTADSEPFKINSPSTTQYFISSDTMPYQPMTLDLARAMR